jgi:bifunctional polynucleotide phosphatase/kinase
MKGWQYSSGLLIRITRYIHEEPEFLYYNKIAGFNFDDTLVLYNNFKPKNKRIIPKLIELHEKKYSIVIFSNQTDIMKGKCSKEEFQERFDNFIKAITIKGIPIIGLFSIKKNFCHKPYTGMWKILLSLYEKSRFPIPQSDQSMYVGNLGGRSFVNKKYIKRKADYGCVDRAFAFNVSMKYRTPDQFFNDEKILRTWSYEDDILTKEERIQIQKDSENIVNPFKYGVRHFIKKYFGGLKQFLIIMVGPPKSSKTTTVNFIKDDTKHCVDEKKIRKWIVIDMNKFGKSKKNVSKKCLKKITEEIMYGNSVIIDGTNHTKEIREDFISLIRDYVEVGILVIEMVVPINVSKHLNHMKIEMFEDFDLLATPKIKFTRFTAEHKKTTIDEFHTIERSRICILYYPFILINSKEWWYIYSK